MKELAEVGRALEGLRERRPLVMCLTNEVASPFTADVLAAAGASPAMIRDRGEAVAFADVCDAALVNTGTVTAEQGETMRGAVMRMGVLGKPWVLDPVAFGPLPLRTELCREFMRAGPSMIRANAAEVAAMAGETVCGRGTDAGGVAADPVLACRVAAACRTVVLMTGEKDYVVSADPVTGAVGSVCELANGHPLLAVTVGTGCAQGALAAAFAAVPDVTPVTAALAAALTMTVAGERAACGTRRPGSFRIALLDALHELASADISAAAHLKFRTDFDTIPRHE